MGRQDAFALDRSNLNGFLFADIGVEGSGMPLSVISALAREGLDPWQEAGRLAGLPRAAATEGLARLIAGMPASLWPLRDSTVIADRLIALLPRDGADPDGPSPVLSNVAFSNGGNRRNAAWLILAVLAMAVLAGVAATVAPTPAPPAAPPPAIVAPANLVPTWD